MKHTIISLVLALLAHASWAASDRVVLAAEDNWYPYSARVDKKAQGRSLDIVVAAYEAAGATLALEVVPFNRGLVLTRNGSYAGVFNASLNDEVRRDYLIPKNDLGVSEQVIVARTGEPFNGKQSFNHKRLALTLGFTYPSDITGDPNNSIQRAAGDLNSLKMIAARHADFTILDRLVFMSLLVREPALKRQLNIVGNLDSYRIYVLFANNDKGREARRLFDLGMDKIARDGTLKSIVDRWDLKLR